MIQQILLCQESNYFALRTCCQKFLTSRMDIWNFIIQSVKVCNLDDRILLSSRGLHRKVMNKIFVVEFVPCKNMVTSYKIHTFIILSFVDCTVLLMYFELNQCTVHNSMFECCSIRYESYQTDCFDTTYKSTLRLWLF